MSQVTEASTLPSWLTITDEGVDVTLKYKSTINGIVVNRLSMRSPSVKDSRMAKEMHPDNHEKQEIQLFSNLTEAHFNDIEALKERDYRRLQEGYFRLVNEDEL